MIDIDDSHEELARLYPDLFQKSEIDGFECGNGWHNILGTLCGLISYDAGQARHRVQFYSEGKDADQEKQAAAEVKLAAAIEALPTIVQVKEKFGRLRFYLHGGTEEQNNWIQFAESMSGRTCETCGDSGKPRNSGWMKTLCDVHHKQLYPEEYQEGQKSSDRAPKLFDEMD